MFSKFGKLFLKTIILSFFVVFISSLLILPVQAFVRVPIGGRVSLVTFCGNTASSSITVIGPRPGVFMLFPTPATRLYSNFTFLPGSWLLGVTTPATTPVPCTTGPVPSGLPGLPIMMTGTSIR